MTEPVAKHTRRLAVAGVIGAVLSVGALTFCGGVASAEEPDPSSSSSATGGGEPAGGGAPPAGPATETPTDLGSGNEPADAQIPASILNRPIYTPLSGSRSRSDGDFTAQDDYEQAYRDQIAANSSSVPADGGSAPADSSHSAHLGSGQEPADNSAAEREAQDADFMQSQMDAIADVNNKLAQVKQQQAETGKKIAGSV